MVHFPVSGVEVNPLVPLLVAFAVSALTAPAGVSGSSYGPNSAHQVPGK